jgi:NTE family protein
MMTTRGGAGGGAEKRPSDPRRAASSADGAVASALSELKELDGSSIEYFVLPPLCPLTGSPYDFSQTGALIDRAIRSTDAWISEGGLERPNVHAPA